jgi:hypothetical protein
MRFLGSRRSPISKKKKKKITFFWNRSRNNVLVGGGLNSLFPRDNGMGVTG